ncbi:MAG TPA: methylmalonyl-CoA mutase, partial [Thermomicrobiales bacterium]|nr:methylmalonyl-CoA mutase [Thermomicrobiales bacterium]
HMAVFPRIMELLRQQGMDDVIVLAGGIFPDEDVPQIKAMGIKGVFGPGTPLNEIVDFIRANAGHREAA